MIAAAAPALVLHLPKHHPLLLTPRTPFQSCSMISWQLMFAPEARSKGAEGWGLRFNFRHDSASCCCCPILSLLPLSPSLPCLHLFSAFMLLCPPSSFTDQRSHLLLVFVCCFFYYSAESSVALVLSIEVAVWWISIDPLNRPRNSSLHQAALCWPRQHSAHKVDRLVCHTPITANETKGPLAIIPPPYSVSPHRAYLNTV